jgi:hypothetical protein
MCRCTIAQQHSGLRCLGPASGWRSDGLCCPRLQHHLDAPWVLLPRPPPLLLLPLPLLLPLLVLRSCQLVA